MKAIATLTKKLDVSIAQGEWRVFAVDQDVELRKETHCPFLARNIQSQSLNATEAQYVTLPT